MSQQQPVFDSQEQKQATSAPEASPTQPEQSPEKAAPKLTVEQEALKDIPWENEISQAFVGAEDFPIEAPKFSHTEEESTPKTHKKALLFFGVGSLAIFLLIWGGSSFMTALGDIQNTAKQKKDAPVSETDEQFWELKTAELETKLSEKNRREAIAQFNAQSKPGQKTGQPQSSSASVPPPASSSPRTSPTRTASTSSSNIPRIQAPRIIYRDPTPGPSYAPKISRATSTPTPKYSAPPSPKPTVSFSRPVSRPTPQIDPQERWNQLAQMNSMGEAGSAQDTTFEVAQGDETGIVEYVGDSGDVQGVSAMPDESTFPVGMTAEAEVTETLKLSSSGPVPVMLDLKSPLGEIPAGSQVSAIASLSGDQVRIEAQGYQSMSGYEPLDSAQIVASVPAKLKGGGNGNKILGKILNAGSDLLNESTGQSVDFDGNGNISSISTNTNNSFLDRAIGSGADILAEQLSGDSSNGDRYYQVKKGTTVQLTVFGG